MKSPIFALGHRLAGGRVAKWPEIVELPSPARAQQEDTYPYFLRTIPPDSLQGHAMWRFIEYALIPSIGFVWVCREGSADDCELDELSNLFII